MYCAGRRGGEKTMKFIHIADVHLGAEPDAGAAYSGRRPKELWDTLEKVLGVCDREQADLLLIAGDLFHRQPLMRELKEVNYLFSELKRTNVVLIAGNHDYIRKDSYYRTFRWAENVTPLFGQSMGYVEFPELETAVYGLSYHRREIKEPLYDRCFAQGRQKYEILLAHGGDDKHIPFNRGAQEKSGFDYIALGHIHKPAVLEENRIIYAGALEPVDRNDTGPHGYVRGEITERGVRARWIPCAEREYIHLTIPVNEKDTSGSIKKKISESKDRCDNKNIYKITLTGVRDEDVIPDTAHMDDIGNVLEIVDETRPAFDPEQLLRENRNNLIGHFIEEFRGCREGSVEYQALCEGLEALLKNKS